MDALIAVVTVASLWLAFRKVGWWKWFWLGLAVYLGVFELAAKLITGRTISQQYWLWASTSHGWWAPALLVALGGIGLAAHLVWKRLKKPKP